MISEAEAASRGGPVIVVRADAVIDAALDRPASGSPGPAPDERGIRRTATACNTRRNRHDGSCIRLLVWTPPSNDEALFLASTPSALKADFWKALRKRETPYAMRADKQRLDAIAWRMFMGTYKGATDVVTKHLWPVPAFYATRFLAPRRCHAQYGDDCGDRPGLHRLLAVPRGPLMPGDLAGAWPMTFLDTVDGKLARTTLTSSPNGATFSTMAST